MRVDIDTRRYICSKAIIVKYRVVSIKRQVERGSGVRRDSAGG